MNKFNVCDRVFHYDAFGKVLAVVTKIIDNDFIVVDIDSDEIQCHVKQVRKIVKKHRREFWVRECELYSSHNFYCKHEIENDLDEVCNHCEIIRVREVKKK